MENKDEKYLALQTWYDDILNNRDIEKDYKVLIEKYPEIKQYLLDLAELLVVKEAENLQKEGISTDLLLKNVHPNIKRSTTR